MEENNIVEIVTQISKKQRKQLNRLLKEFQIECEEKNRKKSLVVIDDKKSKFTKILRKSIKKIKELRNHQLDKEFAGYILDGYIEDSRLFMICLNNRLIGFEMAQIEEDDDRFVGYKSWMYIQKEFRYTSQDFLNSQGKVIRENIALQLDKTVEEWFKENNVNFEKTCTGVNMLPNIITYIGLGFKPVSKNKTTVFFEKDLKHPLTKKEIIELIQNAKKGNICPTEDKFKKRLSSGLTLKKQRENSGKFTKNAEEKMNDGEKRLDDKEGSRI